MQTPTDTSEAPSITTPDLVLLDLPHHLLVLILQNLDLVSLCSIARCNSTLLRLSAHPSLWPAAIALSTGDWALGGVKIALAHILKLPPQVFNAQLDVRRSRRFPVSVPLHNLRTILATSDAEGLADRVSRALQAQVQAAHNNLWRYGSWQELPAAATISICRADGASIRAALRPQAVVPRMVRQLQQAGWPHVLPTAAATSTPQHPASLPNSSAGSSSSSGVLGDLPTGLLQVLQLCRHRMGLLHTQQLQELQHLRGAPRAKLPLHTEQHTAHQAAAAAAARAVCPSWRPNLPALHAAAVKLPDETTVRLAAARVMEGQGLAHTAAAACLADTTLEGLAVRLFWVAVASDPSCLSFSAAGNVSGWQLPLSHAAKVAVRLQALQQVAAQACGGQQERSSQHSDTTCPAHLLDADCPEMQLAWQRAGSAELQLCQAGLQQFCDALSLQHNPACQPALVYRCVQALDVAAGEYKAAYRTQSLVCRSTVTAGALGGAGAGGDDSLELLKCCMNTELLRALHWCLWLLGAV